MIGDYRNCPHCTNSFIVHLHLPLLILPCSSLQVNAFLQVKMAFIYFAKFHKHAGVHAKTHRTRLHMHLCMHACTHTHTHTHECRLYEYSNMTLTERSVCSQEYLRLVESTHPLPECTHKPVCPVTMSSVNKLSDRHLSLLHKFTTAVCAI